MTAWLLEYRHRIGPRTGRRASTVRAQAKLVLRWFQDDAPLRQLATEAGIGISTAYRYLHEGIDVIAEEAPDLHDVLARRQARRVVAREPGRDVDHHRPGSPRGTRTAITCGTRASSSPKAATCRSSPTRAGFPSGPAPWSPVCGAGVPRSGVENQRTTTSSCARPRSVPLWGDGTGGQPVPQLQCCPLVAAVHGERALPHPRAVREPDPGMEAGRGSNQ